ncbi:MAG: unsaturated glucuronyl hydrolase [Parcubacteria group bacterium Gr01-1014_106]|nr:MAG: unsaturated glucuronyl hydrolase [Parcubacteria group bacterium Gr01-1014_106]
MARFFLTLVTVGIFPFSTALAAPSSTLHTDIPGIFLFARSRLQQAARTLPVTGYPITTDTAGKWKTTNAGAWTSGFFLGSLWLLYEQSGSRIWRTYAQPRHTALNIEKNNKGTHDLGFMFLPSFRNGYRLTKNDQYRRTLLTAAESLATRYSPEVGAIKSWETKPSEFPVIIDSLMNIELLFWGAARGGDPLWRDIALKHARKIRREHVRPDGSTYHVVTYHPETGEVEKKSTAQGKSNESTWSRGQAWALYGFTMVYRETNDASFLQTARTVADYFLAHLPSDGIPLWDFNASSSEPRDSSAAAIAASGLLELSRLEKSPAKRARYFAGAERILRSLSSPAYLAKGTAHHALLLHGTYHKPTGDFDTGTAWGDYYFLEALLRYQRHPLAQ